jgi:SAM-dependent methyltransferase
MQTPEMNYGAYFQPGSLRGLWREGHPYIFEETYHLMQRAFGYRANYVNFGYWDAGVETEEAGRRMAILMGDALGLKAGERLIEGGSGLGQAAVDLCQTYELAEVVGMNPCEPQVRFANDLAHSSGCGEQVNHRICDATKEVFTLEPGSYDHGIAMECIGIFPDPGRFLEGVAQAIRPGGRMVFTVVTCPRSPGWLQQRVSRLFFGTQARPPAYWTDVLTRAGFVNIKRQDITAEVFPPMLSVVRKNLAEEPELLRIAGPFVGGAIRVLISQAERGVAAGTMAYEMFVAERP